jgi:preprotein translocase subunit SecE
MPNEELDQDAMEPEEEDVSEPEEQDVEVPEGKAAQKSAAKSSKKPAAKKKKKGGNRVAKWFREMRSELKKVVWPTPKQIVNNTLIALSLMAASAVVIWALDQVGGQIFQAIRVLGGR